MSNLALIRPQRVDFDTCQTCDWLDGLPLIGVPGSGGTRAGTGNVGNGSIAVASVAVGAALGAHIVTVTAVVGGQTRISVVDPSDTVTGSGVAGLPLVAGGITFTVSPGSAPFAVGDSFAIAVVPVPVDITGLRFDLDARASPSSATIALQASSAGLAPTIATGGPDGTTAMAVPRAIMARAAVKPDGYPYAITATDPDTGLTVPVFYGLIHHTANAAQIGQG